MTDSSIGSTRPALTLSVVSHGQGGLIRNLLSDLRNGIGCSYEVLLTINMPEDESFLEGFRDLPIRVIRNECIKGFGANHNAAFSQSEGVDFAVVNPDIRLDGVDLAPTLRALHSNRVGACGPVVLNAQGRVEDSARRFPSFLRLTRRVASRMAGRTLPADYTWQQEPLAVDWLAGMFVLFRREAFAQVHGFDEGYFMYLEDADICRRLARLGWVTMLDPGTKVIHDARRASHRNLKHLRWHVASAWRFMSRG